MYSSQSACRFWVSCTRPNGRKRAVHVTHTVHARLLHGVAAGASVLGGGTTAFTSLRSSCLRLAPPRVRDAATTHHGGAASVSCLQCETRYGLTKAECLGVPRIGTDGAPQGEWSAAYSFHASVRKGKVRVSSVTDNPADQRVRVSMFGGACFISQHTRLVACRCCGGVYVLWKGASTLQEMVRIFGLSVPFF